MKKLLNEWKEFLNENEGEDNRVRKMTPAGDLEYFEMIMDNGDSYIVEYDPSSEEVIVYAIQDAGEELAARALRYIHQDLPYDQERLPEDEVAVSSFDKRKQQIVRIHDGFVESLEVEGKFPIGEIPKSVMDALMNAAIVTADAMGGDEAKRKQIEKDKAMEKAYYQSGMYSD
jgi:hypothetical protein